MVEEFRLFHLLDFFGHEISEHLVVFCEENPLETEQLSSFAEESQAVLKWIVLLEKLRFHSECLQEFEQFNPLMSLWYLPRVAYDNEKDFKEASLKLYRSPDQPVLFDNLVIKGVYFSCPFRVVQTLRVVSRVDIL